MLLFWPKVKVTKWRILHFQTSTTLVHIFSDHINSDLYGYISDFEDWFSFQIIELGGCGGGSNFLCNIHTIFAKFLIVYTQYLPIFPIA